MKVRAQRWQSGYDRAATLPRTRWLDDWGSDCLIRDYPQIWGKTVQIGIGLHEYGQTFLAQPEELDVRRVEKPPPSSAVPKDGVLGGGLFLGLCVSG